MFVRTLIGALGKAIRVISEKVIILNAALRNQKLVQKIRKNVRKK